MLRTSDFDYELPKACIAQVPQEPRHEARLMVVERNRRFEHRRVCDLPSLLPEGALLVVNDTKVIPARLAARKPTGGQAELLLVEPIKTDEQCQRWRCLGRASKPFRPGPLDVGARFAVEVVQTRDEFVEIDFWVEPSGFDLFLAARGEVPLPPYIDRQVEPADAARYQTLFAEVPGAVAAPTAGLHFTAPLLRALSARNIEIAAITLHVGPGTFAPVRGDEMAQHRMHHERYVVAAGTAGAIERARSERRTVVAVGTTVARTLETVTDQQGRVRAGAGSTDLFLSPGHRFVGFDALMTNFHLPRSTLLMLVAAFAGRERILAAYADAIASGYRFYSYGDAMLLK